jgi:hypothetical protein
VQAFHHVAQEILVSSQSSSIEWPKTVHPEHAFEGLGRVGLNTVAVVDADLRKGSVQVTTAPEIADETNELLGYGM